MCDPGAPRSSSTSGLVISSSNVRGFLPLYGSCVSTLFSSSHTGIRWRFGGFFPFSTFVRSYGSQENSRYFNH
jgi:hypothetical protein